MEREDLQDRLSFFMWTGQSENKEHIKKYKECVQYALEYELTKKQKELMKRYYIDGLTMEKVAEELSVNKSTVSRNLKHITKKLNHLRVYADILLREN